MSSQREVASGPFTALVLAASRGAADPVARAEGLRVDTAGTPMLSRVLAALQASPSVSPIAISIEDPSLLDAPA